MRFRAEIEAMLDQRKWPIEWVESQIATGGIVCHENATAMIGVEVRVYPGGLRELHGMFAVGALEGILSLIDDAVLVATYAGCDTATISSRPGWAKVLKDKGFTVDQVTITKDLHDGA